MERQIVTITFGNELQCGEEIVGCPSTKDGKCIGSVDKVNKDFITGSIYADAIPELNCETKQECSFEIRRW